MTYLLKDTFSYPAFELKKLCIEALRKGHTHIVYDEVKEDIAKKYQLR